MRKRVDRPESEWIVRQIEPLIDERTWRSAQARFRTGEYGAPGKYLLSGLLVCSMCGSRMTIVGGSQRRYTCGTNHGGGASACANSLTVPRAIVEQYILEPVIGRLLDPDSIAEAIRTMRSETAESTVSREQQQLDDLRRMVREGLLSAEIAAPAIAEAQRRVRMSKPTPLPTANQWRQAVADMRSLLRGDDVAAAREALLEWLGEVRMQPDGDHYLATVRARHLLIDTGTGICVGSGGRI